MAPMARWSIFGLQIHQLDIQFQPRMRSYLFEGRSVAGVA